MKKAHTKSAFPAVLVLSIIAALALAVINSPAQSGDPLPNQRGGILVTGTTPTNGTNTVNTLTFTGTLTGTTFKLGLGSTYKTGAIAWSSTNAVLVANIDTAVELLPTVGSGNVVTAVGTATSGIGTFTVTFSGTNVAKRPMGNFTVSAFTGSTGTVVSTNTTLGITADGRSATHGQLLVDQGSGSGAVYINTGTAPNVNWSKVGP